VRTLQSGRHVADAGVKGPAQASCDRGTGVTLPVSVDASKNREPETSAFSEAVFGINFRMGRLRTEMTSDHALKSWAVRRRSFIPIAMGTIEARDIRPIAKNADERNEMDWTSGRGRDHAAKSSSPHIKLITFEY